MSRTLALRLRISSIKNACSLPFGEQDHRNKPRSPEFGSPQTALHSGFYCILKKCWIFFKKHLIFAGSCAIIFDTVFGIRGCGGIGRRAGFRCQWQQCRVGSSPVIRTRDIEVWLSLVERCVRDAEAVGSSPVTSTTV